MARYRLEICKGEEVRFISHLDFMKAFERALRRAKIPVAFSEGFNPHPKIAFASALPVGVTSACELVDLELQEELPAAEVKQRLEKALPPGIKVNAVNRCHDKQPALMAVINRSEYLVRVQAIPGAVIHYQLLQEAIKSFLGKDALVVEKKTKKGLRERDIRKGVYSLRGWLEGNDIMLEMVLQTGTEGNVRPEDVLSGLISLGLPLDKDFARVHRTRLFSV